MVTETPLSRRTVLKGGAAAAAALALSTLPPSDVRAVGVPRSAGRGSRS
ncbi:twin-arginine translocation signal domain-containing protein [Modestobacter excelsi]|nr:twin-arginine translocation signal domain-containing protein [Modestobacter excelsi]